MDLSAPPVPFINKLTSIPSLLPYDTRKSLLKPSRQLKLINTAPYNEKINVDLLMSLWVLFHNLLNRRFNKGIYNYI